MYLIFLKRTTHVYKKYLKKYYSNKKDFILTMENSHYYYKNKIFFLRWWEKNHKIIAEKCFKRIENPWNNEYQNQIKLFIF